MLSIYIYKYILWNVYKTFSKTKMYNDTNLSFFVAYCCLPRVQTFVVSIEFVSLFLSFWDNNEIIFPNRVNPKKPWSRLYIGKLSFLLVTADLVKLSLGLLPTRWVHYHFHLHQQYYQYWHCLLFHTFFSHPHLQLQYYYSLVVDSFG